MTSHSLAICKASLAAGLMRPDPHSVPRDGINEFHSLLDAALARCSPANIQRCKSWLLKNVLASANRITLVAKYLLALSTAQSTDSEGQGGPRRKQLNILYLCNDILHHTKYHGGDPSEFAVLVASLEPWLEELFGFAAGHTSRPDSRQHRRVDILLEEWDRQSFYTTPYLQRLRNAVASAGKAGRFSGNAGDGESDVAVLPSTKDIPYTMPALHGDPSSPYYELPAANMMPHIIPNSAQPIRPQMVKPLQLVAGPADTGLVEAVKGLLKEVESIYGHGEESDLPISLDMDELGQSIGQDGIAGEVLAGEGYYGWSKSFCTKMQQRRKGKGEVDLGRRRSSSRSQSRSPRKRRRYSSPSRSSGSRSLSRNRISTHRSRNGDSRLRSGSQERRRRYSPSFSPARSRRGTRSRSPRRQSSHSRSRSVSAGAGRERSYSPPPPPPPAPGRLAAAPPSLAPPPPPPPLFAFPSNLFPHGIPLGLNGLPIPPPLPPNYSGPWPPPPPQMASLASNLAQVQALLGPPPPPPPPPLAAQGWQVDAERGMLYGQHQQQEQGWGTGRGRGYSGSQHSDRDPRRGGWRGGK